VQGTPDLGEVPVFRHLDPEEREELEGLMEPAYFDAGQQIFREGGPEEKLYVITSGTIEVHKKILRKRRQHLATVTAPTVVGEMGLLTEPRAAATVEAVTPVEAHGIDRDRLLQMLDDDSPAACKLVFEIGRTLAERMAKTDQTVAEVIARLEDAQAGGGDVDVFRDQLARDWSF
jgi:CRP/FNR family cyclic AMP-dependent transcriptional regulator